jgi:hypothetical protein
MITTLDQSVLNFLSDFHIATSGQICQLYYPGKYSYCMKRLRGLNEDGFIKRMHSTINNCNAYYSDKKPVQVHHDLIRSELYMALKTKYDVL